MSEAIQRLYDATDDDTDARACEWCERRSHSVRTRTYAAHGLRRTVTACGDCYEDWVACHGDMLRDMQLEDRE